MQATVELYRSVVRELLPTPTKSHYLFNTRDLARVIQGTMRASKSFYDTKDSMLALWVRPRAEPRLSNPSICCAAGWPASPCDCAPARRSGGRGRSASLMHAAVAAARAAGIMGSTVLHVMSMQSRARCACG